MRIIPVLDLKAGQAVHAVAGDRAHYRPLRSILHDDSDPLELARAYRDRLGATELYLADLDAIAGGPPATGLQQAIVRLGLAVWVDAGVRSAEEVAISTVPLTDGSGVLVLGLETLAGPEELRAAVAQGHPDRLAFSLDLRDGRPLVAAGVDWGTDDPYRLAAVALECGLRRLIVLDLARVGTGRGVGTVSLLRALRRRHPGLELVAGGGIAGPGDLAALEDAGASAALVASALHDGRLDLRDRLG
jgi:phosphoribosylformimino-5-aminoimidazole carboxamide ribotide isomerase